MSDSDLVEKFVTELLGVECWRAGPYPGDNRRQKLFWELGWFDGLAFYGALELCVAWSSDDPNFVTVTLGDWGWKVELANPGFDGLLLEKVGLAKSGKIDGAVQLDR